MDVSVVQSICTYFLIQSGRKAMWQSCVVSLFFFLDIMNIFHREIISINFNWSGFLKDPVFLWPQSISMIKYSRSDDVTNCDQWIAIFNTCIYIIFTFFWLLKYLWIRKRGMFAPQNTPCSSCLCSSWI